MTKLATIKDVAKMAGVSISTVSLAFNNPERVTEATRDKIFGAVRSLNYVPANVNKKTVLGKKKSQSIAVICPKLVGPYHLEIIQGISETIYMNQKDMVLYAGDDAINRYLLNIVESHAYQGVILVNGPIYDERYLRAAAAADFPVVMCCFRESYKGIGSILINESDIGRRVAEHFLKRKFRKIGIVGTPAECSVMRKECFLQTLAEKGIRVPAEWDLQCELAEDPAYKTVDRFLHTHEEYPEAIFCQNDDSAIGVIEAIEDFGLRVPEDISIIGCDGLNRSKFHSPSLSTIETPKMEVGMLAVNLLMREIAGMSSEEIILNGKLILRESCL